MKHHFALAILLPLLATLAPLASQSAAAQGWSLDLSAGHSLYDGVQTDVGAAGVIFGARHHGPHWFFVAGGVPVGSAGLPWGALGLGGRFATPGTRLSLGVDVGGHGFAFANRDAHQGGGGATLVAMPVVELRADRLRVELRSGGVHYAGVFSGATAGRSIHQSDARLTLDGGDLVVAAESRWLRAEEGDYPYVGGILEGRFERLTVAAHAGSWLADAIQASDWGVGARLRLHADTEAHIGWQQESSDPLYWNSPRRSWNVGLSHRVGRKPTRGGSVPAPEPGERGTTFRLPLAKSPGAPRLAGDFSGWAEVPMVRGADAWSVTLPISAGVYRYAFRGADGVWFVPESFPGREPDGYGGFNAVLIVP
jgi:hypothetical protein